MGKASDPFWGIVESFGIDSIPVLPEWIEKKLKEKPPPPPEGIPATMEELRKEAEGCMKCELGRTRKNMVFGEGNPESGILLIGEGPGASEDETGRPFVGRSGKLLDKILESIDLNRQSIYIANIVKCRPPGNRVPTLQEADVCGRYLKRQIDIMKPGVIVVLGASAARYVLDTKSGIGVLRGKFHSFLSIPVFVTYHPAALLRSQALKRPVWEDMKVLKAFLEEAGLPRSRKAFDG